MKGVEKLLSIVLAGSMVIGICACNKTGSGKSGKDDDDDDDRGRDRRTERTEEDEEETTETTLDLEAYWEDEYWFIDPSDEATMKHFVDCMIACEPRLGDMNITNERSDFGQRVWDGFDKHYSGNYGMSSQGEFVFEYGNSDREDLIKRRDHVGLVAYNSYEKETLGDMFDFKIVSYAENYMHPLRPGSCEASIYIYDEARAEKCKQILIDYLSEIYKDEIIRTEDQGIWGYYMFYGDSGVDYVCYVRLVQLRDDDKNPIDTWFIDVCVTFNTPELMRADVIAESEAAATAPSTVSTDMTYESDTTTSISERNSWFDDDDDWDDDDDDDWWDDDDDFWDDDDDDDWDDDWDY